MADRVIIKKYENRRLYDTESSSYVNLQDVARLVREGREVEVRDAKTGEDLTRQVLTQIIVEGAKDPQGGPPVEFLRDLVRAGDQAQRDFFQWYLAAAHELYDRLQEAWSGPRSGSTPWEAWAKLWDPGQTASSLLHLWGPPGKRPAEEEKESGRGPRREIDVLRERLDELERRLDEES